MTPEAPNIPIVRWYSLLYHLVCILYGIVSCAVRVSHSLKTCPCRQVLGVPGVNDTIPRLANPLLHCFVYPCASYQYVNVWRAPALKFEEPKHTQIRDLTAQGFDERLQVSFDILTIVRELSRVREG